MSGQLRRGAARLGNARRHLHREQRRLARSLARHCERSCTANEARFGRFEGQPVERDPACGQRGMTDEIDFEGRREPPDVEPIAMRREEHGLRQIHLCGDRLHHRLGQPCLERHHGCGIARHGPIGKGIDDIDRQCHG